MPRWCLRNKLLREKHESWKEIDIGFELSENKKFFSAHDLLVILEGFFFHSHSPDCGDSRSKNRNPGAETAAYLVGHSFFDYENI